MLASLLVFLLIPTIIAYFFCWLTIIFFYYPKNKIQIFGLSIQGIIPSKINGYVHNIIDTIFIELNQNSNFTQILSSSNNIKSLNPLVERKVDDFIRIKLAKELPMISAFIGESTITKLKKVFMNELEIILPELIESYFLHLKTNEKIKKLALKQLLSFVQSDNFEKKIKTIIQKKSYIFKIWGGCIGFIIGLILFILNNLLLKN